MFVLGVTCKQPISAQSKISMVEGQPCCVNCYEEKHAKRCSRCQKPIVADVEYLEFDDKYWHKECFTCSKCQVRRCQRSFYSSIFVCFSFRNVSPKKVSIKMEIWFYAKIAFNHSTCRELRSKTLFFFFTRKLFLCACVCVAFKNLPLKLLCRLRSFFSQSLLQCYQLPFLLIPGYISILTKNFQMLYKDFFFLYLKKNETHQI